MPRRLPNELLARHGWQLRSIGTESVEGVPPPSWPSVSSVFPEMRSNSKTIRFVGGKFGLAAYITACLATVGGGRARSAAIIERAFAGDQLLGLAGAPPHALTDHHLDPARFPVSAFGAVPPVVLARRPDYVVDVSNGRPIDLGLLALVDGVQTSFVVRLSAGFIELFASAPTGCADESNLVAQIPLRR